MLENPVEEQQPVASGAGQEPVQPEGGPSQEAAPVAAAEDPIAKLKAELEQERERRRRQQSVLDTRASEAVREAEESKRQMAELQRQLDELRMKDMPQEQRDKYLSSKMQAETQAERQALAEQRAELQRQELNLGWFNYWAQQGVPVELLNECADPGEMTDMGVRYLKRTLQPPQPTEQAPSAPPVSPADRVHTGGGGAAPAREWDRLQAEGKGPGSKEFRDYKARLLRKAKGGETKELV